MTGCLSDITGSSESDSIKLGGVFLLSGIGASLGQSSKAGAKLGVQEVNKAGGILDRDVEITFHDHEGDASTANQQFKDLVQSEGVKAMIGLTSSGVTLSTASTVAQLGVPLTLTDIGTPFITEHDTKTYKNYYKSDGKAAGQPNIFRTNANTSTGMYAYAKFAHDNLDITRVANCGMDYAYGQQCWDYFKAYSKGLGADYEYVASEFTDIGASNMTPQIKSVLAAKPELVFTSYWGGDAVTFTKQATEQGLYKQSKDVFDTLGADPNVFKSLGSSMPTGYHYHSWYWHSGFKNKQNKQFLDAYWKKYKDDGNIVNIPSFTGPSTYSAIWLYKKAMEKAGTTDPEPVIEQLEGMEFTGPRGTWKIDSDSHQATVPTSIGKTATTNAKPNDGYGPGVPYEGVGLDSTKTYSLDRKTATKLLKGSDLPPGV